MTAKTTVICAVWCGDKERSELLKLQRSNLDRQSVEHDRIYVFDGDDHMDTGFLRRNDTVIRVDQKLTIFQAWNVALSLVQTDYVMNMSLDDRLYGDAIEEMERTLEIEQSFMVGGEWAIRFDRWEVEKVLDRCQDLKLPLAMEWPPNPSDTTVKKLGSGDGSRGTYGPAVMWRMSAHNLAKCSRFPFRFYDGSLIRSAGDAAWSTIIRDANLKTSRIPLVIGNYHSHSGDQAEFRVSGEIEKLQTVGLML